jgi:hypothetical protein
MTGEHPSQATQPRDDIKPAWRVAVVAYREVRRTGQLDHPAWLAARAAILAERPNLDEEAAGREASAAIHYCSVFHTRWLWSGVTSPWSK